MMEGSGAESGCGFEGPKNIRIRIRNTAYRHRQIRTLGGVR
jgi:hypothetical protein